MRIVFRLQRKIHRTLFRKGKSKITIKQIKFKMNLVRGAYIMEAIKIMALRDSCTLLRNKIELIAKIINS